MGCSSSAQTKVKDGGRSTPKSPDANGLHQRDDDLPITDKNDTGPDQTKLEAMEEMKLESPGKKLNEDLAKVEAGALIQGVTNYALSACHRVDPEGTEPQPMAPEEKFNSSQLLSPVLLEAGESQAVESSGTVSNPQAATEAASSLLLESIQDHKPESAESSGRDTPKPAEEENYSPVIEIVKELNVDEEDRLTEGNKRANADRGQMLMDETGEKIETETLHEIIQEASETKEETREVTTATEIGLLMENVKV